MKVTDEMINRLAHLARLEFAPEEMEAIKGDMTKMLAFVDKLSELDTQNAEPLIFMSEEHNVLREDKTEAALDKATALQNAPKSDSDFFRAPKVISK